MKIVFCIARKGIGLLYVLPFICTPIINENCFPQSLQGYLAPSCTALWCLARYPLRENCFPHCLQGNSTLSILSCTDVRCLARHPLFKNSWPHCLQGYLIPLLENIFFTSFSEIGGDGVLILYCLGLAELTLTWR